MSVIRLKIRRQDHPNSSPYWESVEVKLKPLMTVHSALQSIKQWPVNSEAGAITPVVWDANCLEGQCGTCTMLINGRVGLACQTRLDGLDEPVRIEPLTKFPILRDLSVDRKKISQHLRVMKAWNLLDGYYSTKSHIQLTQDQEDSNHLLSACMACGACLEVCPQYNEHSSFVGPMSLVQLDRFENHPNRKTTDGGRDVVLSVRGVEGCQNTQNCVKVCPVHLPITTSIAKLKRRATKLFFKTIFG